MPPLKEYNDVLLTKHNIYGILEYMSERLFESFGGQVQLIAHGGIVMVLHPGLISRKSTRDVDITVRSFAKECRKAGMQDAEERLNSCIIATAKRFRLGADWMNYHCDVALPWAQDPNTGKAYDPIYQASMARKNKTVNTLYSSRGLRLVGVPWSWGAALKLVRYKKDDPRDIVRILEYGCRASNVKWSLGLFEKWLRRDCSGMGYDHYPPQLMEQTRQRMMHAISLLNETMSSSTANPAPPVPDVSARRMLRPAAVPPPPPPKPVPILVPLQPINPAHVPLPASSAALSSSSFITRTVSHSGWDQSGWGRPTTTTHSAMPRPARGMFPGTRPFHQPYPLSRPMQVH